MRCKIQCSTRYYCNNKDNNFLNAKIHVEKTYFVTRPVKTGHVGTNYIPSYNRPYFRARIEYLYSVTFIIKSIIYLIKDKN